MKVKNKIFTIALSLILVSCGVKSNRLTVQAISENQLYNQGIKEINNQNYERAIKTFTKFEEEYPASKNYANVLILKAYSLYSEGKYAEAILTIDDFIQQFPLHKGMAYMYYLKSMSNYTQIMDIGRDQNFAVLAKEDFEMLMKLHPQSKYAEDAKWKLEYIDNILAGKEMDIGRFYLRTSKHISSINRFKSVVENHERSMFTPEALYRLTEVYFILGLKKEATKYASVLGHNYPKSTWYSKAYALLIHNGMEQKNLSPKQVSPAS